MAEDLFSSHARIFPKWEDFFANIREKNEFIFARRVRAFQDEILTSGRLSIISPVTGEPAEAIYSQVLPGGYISYAFNDEFSYQLISSSVRHGYPLSHFIAPGTAVDLANVGGLSEEKQLALQEILKNVSKDKPFDELGDGPQLILGHPNFAHHIWNELSGLGAWADQRRERVGGIVCQCLYEPLGEIEKLFPLLSGGIISRKASTITRRPSGRLSTHVGSTIISEEVRQRVISVAQELSEAHKNDFIKDLPHNVSVFWVTVRPEFSGRACLNQVEFLSTLISKLLKEFPDSCYIFDGFSLPINFHRSTQYAALADSFARRVGLSRQIASQIISNLEEKPSSGEYPRFVDISGLDLAQAITLGTRSDYYISHAGTIQHKVAWLHNSPGFIHSCEAELTPGARRWFSNQIENGVLPDMIDRKQVSDEPADQNVISRNHNYKIVDVDAVVNSVVECAKKHLR